MVEWQNDQDHEFLLHCKNLVEDKDMVVVKKKSYVEGTTRFVVRRPEVSEEIELFCPNCDMTIKMKLRSEAEIIKSGGLPMVAKVIMIIIAIVGIPTIVIPIVMILLMITFDRNMKDKGKEAIEILIPWMAWHKIIPLEESQQAPNAGLVNNSLADYPLPQRVAEVTKAASEQDSQNRDAIYKNFDGNNMESYSPDEKELILREGAMQALMDNDIDYALQLNQEASQIKNHVDFHNIQAVIDYKRNNQEGFFENLKLAQEIGLDGSRYTKYVSAILDKLKSAQ